MKSPLNKPTLGFLLGSFLAGALSAQTLDIPLRNWTVPGGDLTKQADVTPGIGFVGVAPCRIVDTRGTAGPYGAPSMAAGVARDFDIDSGPCTGIPAGVEAYSLNVTVTNTAGPGIIKIYPQGGVQPVVSTLNYVAGETIANAAIVPAGTGGGVTVIAGVSGTDLIIDINGYWTDEYNLNVGFEVNGTNSAQMGLFVNNSTANNTWGVFGRALSTGTLSAGVKGFAGSAEPVVVSSEPSAGVLGVSRFQNGVYGITQDGSAVVGHLHSSTGADLGAGRLGFRQSPSVVWAVFAEGNAHVTGDFTVAGVKSFVEPHRSDASKEIRYISVEAPSAEIYFRGTAKISRGITRIEVPEHFRQVARAGSYATMVTPVGAMATVAVLSEDKNGIVIQASRNVRVHYVVYAERKAFKDHNPVIENVHFRPESAHGFGPGLPEPYRAILVQNGTLNPDGTSNIETVKRLGWDKDWRKGAEDAPHPK